MSYGKNEPHLKPAFNLDLPMIIFLFTVKLLVVPHLTNCICQIIRQKITETLITIFGAHGCQQILLLKVGALTKCTT